jgi:coenzyme F420 hydrogenase subunit beta
MNGAAKASFIHIGDKLKIEDIDDFQPHQVNKKKAVYARHQGIKKKGIPTINTRELRIKELYNLNSKEFNQKEELGVSERIKKINN